jgi:hypothetical protein
MRGCDAMAQPDPASQPGDLDDGRSIRDLNDIEDGVLGDVLRDGKKPYPD